MMAPLSSFAEGVPHGRYHASHPSGSPLAFGAGGRAPASNRCAHRYLLPSTPRACSLVWPWRSSPTPGDSRWPSCSLEGGGTAGGAWDVPLTPAWLDAYLTP